MRKDVTINVPCCNIEMRPQKPFQPTGEKATIHLVPIPAEALAEVREVLKKYESEYKKFNELLQKTVQGQHEVKILK